MGKDVCVKLGVTSTASPTLLKKDNNNNKGNPNNKPHTLSQVESYDLYTGKYRQHSWQSLV